MCNNNSCCSCLKLALCDCSCRSIQNLPELTESIVLEDQIAILHDGETYKTSFLEMIEDSAQWNHITGKPFESIGDGLIVNNGVLSATGDGNGDMLKSVYDANNNGIVDDAENLRGFGPDAFVKQGLNDAGVYVTADVINLTKTNSSNVIRVSDDVAIQTSARFLANSDMEIAFTSPGGLTLNGNKVVTENQLNSKVDKVAGKGLSTNDFTTEYIDLIYSTSNEVNGLLTTVYDIDQDYKSADNAIRNSLDSSVNNLSGRINSVSGTLASHASNSRIHIVDLGTNPNFDNITYSGIYTYITIQSGESGVGSVTNNGILIVTTHTLSAGAKSILQEKREREGIQERIGVIPLNQTAANWEEWHDRDTEARLAELETKIQEIQNNYAPIISNPNEDWSKWIELGARQMPDGRVLLYAPYQGESVFIMNVATTFGKVSKKSNMLRIEFSGDMNESINSVGFYKLTNPENRETLSGEWSIGSNVLYLTLPLTGVNALQDEIDYQLDFSLLRTSAGTEIATTDVYQTFRCRNYDQIGQLVFGLGPKAAGDPFIIPVRGRSQDNAYPNYNWKIETSADGGYTWVDWGNFIGQANEYGEISLGQAVNNMSWTSFRVRITDNTNSPNGMMAFGCFNSEGYPIPQFTNYLTEIVSSTLYGQLYDYNVETGQSIIDSVYFQYHKYEGCNNLTNMEDYASYPIDSFELNNGRFYSTYALCTALTGNGMDLINKISNPEFGDNISTFRGCVNLSDYSVIPAKFK